MDVLEGPAIEEWYNPGKSIREFHESTAFVRCMVGGRGSGKTSGIALEATRHCWHNAGAKVMIVRKTEASQGDTTIDTFKINFRNIGPLYSEAMDGLFQQWNDYKTIRLPSRKAVEAYNKAAPTWKTKGERQLWLDTEGERLCGYIEFRGLPDENKSSVKLRGIRRRTPANRFRPDPGREPPFFLGVGVLHVALVSDIKLDISTQR